MNQTHPAPAGLAGVADLTRLLGRAAAVPGVLVTVDPALGDGAAIYRRGCDPVPRLTVGAPLLAEEPRLAGVLAHEIAHCVLGHLSARRPWRWLSQAAAIVAVALALTGRPWAPVVAAAVVMVAAHLADAHRARREELEADAYSVRLLKAAGLPGRAIVAAALEQLPADGRWYRAAGWIWGGHPTTTARRRALDSRPSRPA